jgi:F-type H+-transporting ATPase subunit delta
MSVNPSLMYALALHSLAKEEGQLKELKDILLDFCAQLDEHSRLKTLLETPNIKEDEKERIIESVTNPYKSSLFTNGLKLIVKQHRILYFKDIVNEYIKLADESLRILHGFIYSKFPLSEKEIQAIEEAVTIRIGTTVKLKNKEDSSILGGVKVVIGDQIFDGTLDNKLEQLKKQLRQRKVDSRNEN